jgi:hypothetical protein
MPSAIYENFDLVITRTGDGAYKASVRDPLGGDASSSFTLSGAPSEVLSAIPRNFKMANAPATPAAAANAASTITGAQNIGKYIFELVFQDGMLAALNLSQFRARSRAAFMRLRINLTDVPELVGLPWEMMCSASDFMALSIQTSVVRYQDVGMPTDDLIVKDKPLRMLVVISNPATPEAPALNVEDEWKKINAALQPLIDQRLIELERLQRATLNQLDDRLFDLNRPVHILHYIGHGAFDEETGKGLLLFETETSDGSPGEGSFDLIDGDRLGQSLGNHSTLRLVVLNSCEGAMVSREDSYAGVAQNLLRAGNVPVVIAMRRVIGDDVAIAFAQTFYQWLLNKNLSVDAAMTRARLRMRDVEQKRDSTKQHGQWSTPVLFMRNHDGYLVNFQDVPSIPTIDITSDPDPVVAKHYQTALAALTKGKLVPFLGLDINLYSRAYMDNWQPTSATLPSYRELANYLATASKHPTPFIPALADVSQYALLHSDDEGTFYDDLLSIFTQPGEPTPLHKFWATIAANNDKLTGKTEATADDVNRRFLIVSSTYDNLLEKAFKQTLDRFHVVSYIAYGENQGKFLHKVLGGTKTNGEMTQAPVVIENPNSYGGLYDQAPVILKIPGTAGDSTKPPFAITEDQYLDLLSRRELASILPSQVLTKLRNSSHLFLGYNIREWSARALLYRIWEDHKTPYASWAIMEQPTDVEKKYWEACKVKVIERSLATYVDGLRQSCQSLLPGVQL